MRLDGDQEFHDDKRVKDPICAGRREGKQLGGILMKKNGTHSSVLAWEIPQRTLLTPQAMVGETKNRIHPTQEGRPRQGQTSERRRMARASWED